LNKILSGNSIMVFTPRDVPGNPNLQSGLDIQTL